MTRRTALLVDRALAATDSRHPAGLVVVRRSTLLNTVAAGLRDRDQAYQAGYESGFDDGYQRAQDEADGLRAVA